MTRKQLIILTVSVLITSCSFLTDNKKNFDHKYAKYWDKYSEQQLIDTLFSDTLMVGPDIDGGWTSREFYINVTQELINDLKDDKYQIDSLYPMKSFEKVTIKKIPIGFKKTFTKEQVSDFLEIINDPVSFDWAESTYEPEYRVDFLKANKVVASLTINEDKSIINTVPDWPYFKKMKFGRLKPGKYCDLVKIINELI